MKKIDKENNLSQIFSHLSQKIKAEINLIMISEPSRWMDRSQALDIIRAIYSVNLNVPYHY